MSHGIIRDQYHPTYPVQPRYDENCSVNVLYKTLPHNVEGCPWPWETTAVGPSSLKHLYTGIPNYYPLQTISRPIGTMYESEFAQYTPTGVKISGQWQVYPFFNRHVREIREYSDQILPYMDNRNWTKYPVKRC